MKFVLLACVICDIEYYIRRTGQLLSTLVSLADPLDEQKRGIIDFLKVWFQDYTNIKHQTNRTKGRNLVGNCQAGAYELHQCTHPVSNHTSKRALYGFLTK